MLNLLKVDGWMDGWMEEDVLALLQLPASATAAAAATLANKTLGSGYIAADNTFPATATGI